MNKHTPGPWNFYDDSNDGKTNRIEIVAIGKTVARIYHSVPDEDLPNARLIAASPELLAFAEEFVDAWENGMAGDSFLLHIARTVIAKATGESK